MFVRTLLVSFLLHRCLSIQLDDQCARRDTCTDQTLGAPSVYDHEDFIQSRNCFCDAACEQYGDCCDKSAVRPADYECVDFLQPTITNRNIPFDRLFIWMRTTCLPIYVGSTAERQCRNLNNQVFNENPIRFIPVTSARTNITYRNYYCAYCNNDASDSIQFWEYKPFCHGDGTDKDHMVLNNDQDVEYYVLNLTRTCLKTIVYPHERGSSRPSVFIRPCKKALPATCPPGTPADLARNCSTSGTAYRYKRNSTIIYQNPYCADCHQPNQTDDITCLDWSLRSAIPPLTHIRIHPLSILFDPNLLQGYLYNKTIPRIFYSMNYNCTNPSELFDLVEQKCRQVTHSSDELIVSMKCKRLMQTPLTAEQTVDYPNGSLHLIDQQILLSKDEYVYIGDDRIIFCANGSIPWASTPTFPIYRNVLSIICTSISLACLLLFGIVFWLIPSLHNLPGKCLLFLSLSLFLGQLTFMSTSNLMSNYGACFASAVLIHYFYLSSFFWLLIISIHVHSTFHHQTIQTSKSANTRHHLIAYNVLIWCVTGIIILVACLIQFTLPQSSFSPAYATMFCSISRANALIVFFLLPIGSTLLVVAILFLKTLLAIYRSHQIARVASASSSSANQKDTNLTFIYARLASLMGIQWTLLVLALAIGQTWAWIVFEIVNSLPGVFICFGFLCSKRVFNTLKNKLSMQLTTRRQSSRSNTTTSTSIASPSLPPVKTSKKFRF